MSKQRKTVLKKNKELGKIWHPDTGLVFKSAKEKIVIGRCVDGELEALDQECVELCAKWKFKYDESLVEEVEEVEETDTDESESEEEEVVEKKSVAEESESEEEEPEPQPSPKKIRKTKVSPKKSPVKVKDSPAKSAAKAIDTSILVSSIQNLAARASAAFTLQKTVDALTARVAELEDELATANEEVAKVTKKFQAVKNLFA